MRTRIILGLALTGLSATLVGSQPSIGVDDAVLDALVFGAHALGGSRAAPEDLRGEVEEYLRRAAAYHSSRPVPSSNGLKKMVHAAQVSYEQRLVAVTADRDGPRLAAAYVDSLRPCYEWEGYHDCPEHEARFADEYQAAHPDGPFSAYLPLLAAHRWLCTAEAYDYEKRPAEASRSRWLYEERLAGARRSPSRLVRAAAERLAVRGRCFAAG